MIMKKIVFIPLAAALIVSGCNTAPQQNSQPAQPGEPPVSSSSSQSQPAPKPSEQPALDLHAHYNVPQSVEIIDHVEGRSELPYNYVSLEFLKRFLSALTAGDWQSAADIASDVEGVFDCFASVVITDAEITKIELVSDEESMVYFDLTVAESDSDFFPTGTSQWVAKIVDQEANWAEYILPADQSVSTSHFADLSKAEMFCFRLASVLPKLNGTEFRDDFDFSTPYDTGQFVDAACVALSSANLPEVPYTPEYYSPEAFYNNVEKVFGMDLRDVDITQYSEYQRTQMVVPVPRGGRWVYSVITESEFDPDTKQYTITFDLYSDTICWVIGKTVQYKLSENEDGSFRLLSVEVLYDSGIDIQVGSI